MKLSYLTLTICLAAASATTFAQGPDAWVRVERLEPGRIIVVTDDSGAAVRGQLLRADGGSILLYAPRIEGRQLKPLHTIVVNSPRMLDHVDRVSLNVPDSKFRISLGGVWIKNVRIASFEEVFHLVGRATVVSVIEPQDQRKSIGPMLAGATIGAVAGWFSAIRIGLDDTPCQPNCGGRAIGMGLSLAGGPVLGSVIGHAIGKPREDLVIYFRP